MPGFLDKLNTLVKASINNVLDEAGQSITNLGSTISSKLPVYRLGDDIDREIAALRKQIDKAIADEDGMKHQIAQMEQQVAAYDQQIDDALQRNDNINARYLGEQIQRLQRKVTILQSDLDEHRQITSEFIERVNMLEAMVADSRHEQTQKVASQPEQNPANTLSNLLREARERVEDMISKPEEVTSIKVQTEPESTQPVNDKEIDEDLAKRRSRLSKPDYVFK
jgi:phage shock protein A